MAEYKGKAYIENGKVKCASQMCIKCEYAKIYKCQRVIIVTTEAVKK